MKIIINEEKLRRDLEDYYGFAMFSSFPMAMIDLSRVECASGDELVRIADECGLDLSKYVIGKLEE